MAAIILLAVGLSAILLYVCPLAMGTANLDEYFEHTSKFRSFPLLFIALSSSAYISKQYHLLNSKNCTVTTFGDIAECDKKYPEHEKEVERFVGLENIEPENFQLQGFGLVGNGTTFTKHFAKGDVLFGKRRAYLKKVAVADYDGICSGDILVIRAKSKKMLQGLLPYYISADAFINHAVCTSAGSLSPRTKWKDLADLEVSIPDLKMQVKILEVLQQLDNTVIGLYHQKTALKRLKQKLLNEILG